jgi:hypothetical protein
MERNTEYGDAYHGGDEKGVRKEIYQSRRRKFGRNSLGKFGRYGEFVSLLCIDNNVGFGAAI